MKRNFFIRMLCLLLCVSMLPLGAAATLLEEDSVTGSGFDGKTTNEMAYVDQFYTGPGRIGRGAKLNSRGRALRKWLSNDESTGDARANSGYLMLDEEVKKNSESDWHLINEFAARFLGPVADYFESGGASAVVSVIDEAAYSVKFPWAGKSAYSYYAQLQQVYYEYVTNLSNELEKVDDTIGDIAKGIESVVKLAPDTIRITTEEDILVLTGTGEGAGLFYSVTELDFDNRRMKVRAVGGSKIRSMSFSSLDRRSSEKNKSITYVLTGLDENDRKKLVSELNKTVEQLEDGKEVLCGMPYQYFTDTSENRGELYGLRRRLKQMKDMQPVEKTIDVSEDLKQVEAIAKKLRIVNDTIQAFNSTGEVTIQQKCYMNTLTSMSQDYLNMLCQWYQDVKSYEVPFGYGHVQRDILAAIAALVKDVLDLQEAASDALTRSLGDAVIYSFGSYASIILDIAEVAGWTGITDFVKVADENLFGSKEVASKVSGVAAIFSIVWNMSSSGFIEYEDKASTIYNLKWSLEELLLDEENGLLVQYGENRTNETACEIIRALDTMKILKLMGENLVEEYYLCDYYDSLGLDVGSAAHVVLRNEMARRASDERLDASDSIIPIIGVCEDVITDEKRAPEDYGPDATIKYIRSVVLECYLQDASQTASYRGKTLTAIPQRYSSLPTTPPPRSRYEVSLYNSPLITENAVDGLVQPTSGSLYVDRKIKLYSGNGVDVFLTGSDYDQYLELEQEINRLLNKYDKVNDGFWRKWEQEDHSKKEQNRIEQEQAYHERLQGTIQTRNWIESFEMYNGSTDYLTHEVKYVPVT